MNTNELKNKTIEFLSGLEGMHSRLKTLHWSTKNHSEHVLTDDIDSSILEYEDKIAECVMGRLNVRFGVGDLKCLLPDAKTLDSLVNEMLNDVITFKKEVDGDILNTGLINILDEFVSDINKWNYLKTLS
jgi:hypothetical protein